VLTKQLTLYQRFLAMLQTTESNREVNSYHQYVYQQGETGLQLKLLQSNKRQLNAQQQLQQLTGQNTIPEQVSEIELQHPEWQQHPRLHLLLLQEQQLKLQLQANTFIV